jgi:hypothetical protein
MAAVTKRFAGDSRESDGLILGPALHELADAVHIDPAHPHKSADSLIPFAASHISPHNFVVSSPPETSEWEIGTAGPK